MRHDSILRSLLWRWIGSKLYRGTFHNWYRARQRVLTMFGATLGPNTKFRRTVRIDRPWNLRAGELAMIGDHVIMRATGGITIGDRAVVSQMSMLTTERCDPVTPRQQIVAGIVLEDDTWVAADSLVLPGALIRKGAVVGARSLVEGELPSWTVCAGEPATPRRPREWRTKT
jgi:putative colanic acid biosynthesis acetyltransferase WcaF